MLLKLVLAAVASFAALAVADYHIGRVDFYSTMAGETNDYEACASDNYNCGCWVGTGTSSNGDGLVEPYPDSGVDLPSFFTLTGEEHSDFCGISQLNHYATHDGQYDVYVNNGDGSVVATCYPNYSSDVSLQCNNAFGAGNVYEYFVCYGVY